MNNRVTKLREELLEAWVLWDHKEALRLRGEILELVGPVNEDDEVTEEINA